MAQSWLVFYVYEGPLMGLGTKPNQTKKNTKKFNTVLTIIPRDMLTQSKELMKVINKHFKDCFKNHTFN